MQHSQMYLDRGLCRKYRIEYSLLGEVDTTVIVLRPAFADSIEGREMIDAVNIGGGMIADRDEFHGQGTVLIHSVSEN